MRSLGRRSARLIAVALLTAIALTCALLSHAQPQPSALYDNGQTVPVSQYLSFAVNEDPDAKLSALVTFPVVTPELQPGILPDRDRRFAAAAWLPQPLFVLGTDTRSREWLGRHRDSLAQLGAFGLVVNVEDAASFRSLQALAGMVPLSPAGSRSLVAGLSAQDVHVYPLLISSDGRILQDLSVGAREAQ